MCIRFIIFRPILIMTGLYTGSGSGWTNCTYISTWSTGGRYCAN